MTIAVAPTAPPSAQLNHAARHAARKLQVASAKVRARVAAGTQRCAAGAEGQRVSTAFFQYERDGPMPAADSGVLPQTFVPAADDDSAGITSRCPRGSCGGPDPACRPARPRAAKNGAAS